MYVSYSQVMQEKKICRLGCVCVCVQIFTQINKEREREGGRRESRIYRENDIEKRAQILTLGESGCRVHRNSLNYLEVLLYV